MSFKNELNRLCKDKIPCFFLISYKKDKYFVAPLKDLPNNVRFCFSPDNFRPNDICPHSKEPISFLQYKSKFDALQRQIRLGNTYILNLTQPTKISTNCSLLDIYKSSNSLFNLYFKDEFVCFSPEKFIEIKNNKIYTYPMKGTINSNIQDAPNKLLKNKKELSEHIMIVDLLRNDLSIVASKVKVNRFRYLSEVKTKGNTLFQTSSTISGDLNDDWQSKVGDILDCLLPAGSISGAPKRSSCEIIETIEKYERGYFSGIAGVFDGHSLKSFVLIRFVQKLKNGAFIYKSGGGITIDSDCKHEYDEMIDKVYLC